MVFVAQCLALLSVLAGSASFCTHYPPHGIHRRRTNPRYISNLQSDLPADFLSNSQSDFLDEELPRAGVKGVPTEAETERCVLVGCQDNSLQAKKRKRMKKVGIFGGGTPGGGGENHPVKDTHFAVPALDFNDNDEYEAYDDLDDVYDELDELDEGDSEEDELYPPRESGSVADSDFTLGESLEELRSLALTAGLEPVGTPVTQLLSTIRPRTYIGRGKIAEIKELISSYSPPVCTVLFDVNLSPRQLKYLTLEFNKETVRSNSNIDDGSDAVKVSSEQGIVKVIDRTLLILDIFASRAKTREAVLQVELAMETYRSPRLTGLWTHLSRQSGSGGVGLRGPGERQLETDKRLMRDKIQRLQKEIDKVSEQRKNLSTSARGRRLGLVGYTNAGKSTFLNFVCNDAEGAEAEDVLFKTLDPTTRRLDPSVFKLELEYDSENSSNSEIDGDSDSDSDSKKNSNNFGEIMVTDTVGFVQKLPTSLVAAFRSTLESAKSADVLIHIVDASSPNCRKQADSVIGTLNEIGAGSIPVVTVFNKMDIVKEEDMEKVVGLAKSTPNSVLVSCATGEGMSEFAKVLERALSEILVEIDVLIPYSRGDLANFVFESGQVESREYQEEGVRIIGRFTEEVKSRCREYTV